MVLVNAELQQRIQVILKKIAEYNKIANAYIFSGPDGVGKSVIAQSFIKSINCLEEKEHDCECKNCASINKSRFPDIVKIDPDGAKIKVGQIRELKKITQYGPSYGKWQSIIINGAEKFTVEAANSFLKLLEEPPKGVMFILITSNISSIMDTLISRSQVLDFSQLSIRYVMESLMKENLADKEKLDSILSIAQGEYNLAKVLVARDMDEIFSSIDNIKSMKVIDILKLSEKIVSSDKDEIVETLNLIVLYLMNKIRKINIGNDIQLIRSYIAICMESLKLMKSNINTKLQIENMFLKMQYINR